MSKNLKTVDVKDCSRLVLVQTQPWSDRQAFQEHGLVKGVQVKKNGESKRGNINEMRLLHGSTWHPWRRTGYKKVGSVQKVFELEENENVVAE